MSQCVCSVTACMRSMQRKRRDSPCQWRRSSGRRTSTCQYTTTSRIESQVSARANYIILHRIALHCIASRFSHFLSNAERLLFTHVTSRHVTSRHVTSDHPFYLISGLGAPVAAYIFSQQVKLTGYKFSQRVMHSRIVRFVLHST